jgi:hypothetical protein
MVLNFQRKFTLLYLPSTVLYSKNIAKHDVVVPYVKGQSQENVGKTRP